MTPSDRFRYANAITPERRLSECRQQGIRDEFCTLRYAYDAAQHDGECEGCDAHPLRLNYGYGLREFTVEVAMGWANREWAAREAMGYGA